MQTVYLDPEIGMSKREYLSEKKPLDNDILIANADIEKIESELKSPDRRRFRKLKGNGK